MYFSLSPSPLCNYNRRCHSAGGGRGRKRKERAVIWCSYASLPLALSPLFSAPLLVNKQSLTLVSYHMFPNSSMNTGSVSLLLYFYLSNYEQHLCSWHVSYILLVCKAKVSSRLQCCWRPMKMQVRLPWWSSGKKPLPGFTSGNFPLTLFKREVRLSLGSATVKALTQENSLGSHPHSEYLSSIRTVIEYIGKATFHTHILATDHSVKTSPRSTHVLYSYNWICARTLHTTDHTPDRQLHRWKILA